MELTIHYKLKSNVKSVGDARRIVEALRERALKLPAETDNMERTARVIATLIGDTTTQPRVETP